MKLTLLTLLIVSLKASQLLNSVNEVNMEGQAFISRMASLSDEAKEAASDLAAHFFSAMQDETSALSMFLALPKHVQHELKHVFPEFFDEMDEEEERIDQQSRAFSLA